MLRRAAVAGCLKELTTEIKHYNHNSSLCERLSATLRAWSKALASSFSAWLSLLLACISHVYCFVTSSPKTLQATHCIHLLQSGSSLTCDVKMHATAAIYSLQKSNTNQLRLNSTQKVLTGADRLADLISCFLGQVPALRGSLLVGRSCLLVLLLCCSPLCLTGLLGLFQLLCCLVACLHKHHDTSGTKHHQTRLNIFQTSHNLQYIMQKLQSPTYRRNKQHSYHTDRHHQYGDIYGAQTEVRYCPLCLPDAGTH